MSRRTLVRGRPVKINVICVVFVVFVREKEKQGAAVQVAPFDSEGHVMERSAAKEEESVGSHMIRRTDAWGGGVESK